MRQQTGNTWASWEKETEPEPEGVRIVWSCSSIIFKTVTSPPPLCVNELSGSGACHCHLCRSSPSPSPTPEPLPSLPEGSPVYERSRGGRRRTDSVIWPSPASGPRDCPGRGPGGPGSAAEESSPSFISNCKNQNEKCPAIVGGEIYCLVTFAFIDSFVFVLTPRSFP